MGSWKAEWVAIGISVAALLVSGGGIYYQQQELAVAQQQWADERGKIDADAHVSTYNERWTEKPAGSNIPESELVAPVELYIIIKVTNSGATPTAVKEVGIWKSGNEKLKVAAVLCDPADRTKPTVSCNFPVRIPEFGNATFYLPLSQYLKTDLQCNEYVKDNGIRGYVERIDGDLTMAASDATVAAASYCPFTPPKP
jgi:hypothetical protein